MERISIARTVQFSLDFSQSLLDDLHANHLVGLIQKEVRGVARVEREPGGHYWVVVEPYHVQRIDAVIERVEQRAAAYIKERKLACTVAGP